MTLFPAGSLVSSADSFFVDFFFHFFGFLRVSVVYFPTEESIVFVAKNNDDRRL
jgi:hypothetical protein